MISIYKINPSWVWIAFICLNKFYLKILFSDSIYTNNPQILIDNNYYKADYIGKNSYLVIK
jgi:hypothetical protein